MPTLLQSHADTGGTALASYLKMVWTCLAWENGQGPSDCDFIHASPA